MTHAVELIGIKNPELIKQDVYIRLVNAMSRMHRTSEAMLWLTSAVESKHYTQINLRLARMKQDILQTYNNHNLKLVISEHGKLLLPIPEEVFEFIVFNLVNNAVHHGKVDSKTNPLRIDITDNSLCFKNAVVNDELSYNNSTSNFGLGLSLVSKLCQRFGLVEHIEINNNIFSIEIKTTI